MDERQRAFAALVDLLQRVVAQRGGDPSTIPQQYVWPGAVAGHPAPAAAVSLAPLLTGGGHPQLPDGVVPVPIGLAPPPKP